MAEFFNQWSTAEARIDYSLKKYYKYTKNEDPTRLVSNRFVLINIKMLDNKNGRFSKKAQHVSIVQVVLFPLNLHLLIIYITKQTYRLQFDATW